MLEALLEEAFAAFDAALGRSAAVLRLEETGTVLQVSSSIARVRGLPGLKSEELVAFAGGLLGMAFNLDADEIGVVLLGPSAHLSAGDEARLTGRLVDTPVGEGLLGRVLDATGRALDAFGQ